MSIKTKLKERWKNIGNNFVNILESYNRNYGEVEIIKTKENFIIYLYNGGWSDNEGLESELKNIYNPLLNNHPITIFVLTKVLIKHYNIDFYNYLDSHSEFKEKYEYKIELK